MWLIITAIGVGGIAKKCHSHNNNGVPIFFNRRKDLVEQYKLPVNSYNNICLNKLRVYVHKDICGKLKEQQILYVRHCENKILPNVRYGDFFPCATHIYLNNKCVSDSDFNAADYRLISDDQLKLFALKCIWGLKIQDYSPNFLAAVNTSKSKIEESEIEESEIDYAIRLLDEFKAKFNDYHKDLDEVFKSIITPKKLKLEGKQKKKVEEKPKEESKEGGEEKDEKKVEEESKEGGEEEDEKKVEEEQKGGSRCESLEFQLSGEPNPYVQCGNFIARLEQLMVECACVINTSRAPEILNIYQKESRLKGKLDNLEKSLKDVVKARDFCDKMIADCATYCSALSTSSSIPSIGLLMSIFNSCYFGRF